MVAQELEPVPVLAREQVRVLGQEDLRAPGKNPTVQESPARLRFAALMACGDVKVPAQKIRAWTPAAMVPAMVGAAAAKAKLRFAADLKAVIATAAMTRKELRCVRMTAIVHPLNFAKAAGVSEAVRPAASVTAPPAARARALEPARARALEPAAAALSS